MSKSKDATASALVEPSGSGHPDQAVESRRGTRDDDVITFEEYLEIPELDDTWAAPVEITPEGEVIRRGRPRSPAPKQLLTLRLPPDLIEYFRAHGPGWQRRIEDVLRAARSVERDTAERRAAFEAERQGQATKQE